MIVRFNKSSEFGLRWFDQYYKTVFPQGRRNGMESLHRAIQLLEETERAGHPYREYDDVREVSVQKTPFTLIYLTMDGAVEIVDIRDTRGLRSDARLRKFLQSIAPDNPA